MQPKIGCILFEVKRALQIDGASVKIDPKYVVEVKQTVREETARAIVAIFGLQNGHPASGKGSFRD